MTRIGAGDGAALTRRFAGDSDLDPAHMMDSLRAIMILANLP
jgi:hypothetical protein